MDLKTAHEWATIDGVTLLTQRGRQFHPKQFKSDKITFEQWTDMVLSSDAFRINR